MEALLTMTRERRFFVVGVVAALVLMALIPLAMRQPNAKPPAPASIIEFDGAAWERIGETVSGDIGMQGEAFRQVTDPASQLQVLDRPMGGDSTWAKAWVSRRHGKLHGLCRWVRKDGSIREKRYRDGKQEGVSELWDEAGTLRQRHNWIRGEQFGLQEAWHANGKPMYRYEAAGDRELNGQYWTADGKLTDRTDGAGNETRVAP